MVKKFKSAVTTSSTDSQLASAVRDSAQQIWLAGLGAFAKAQDEGAKVFEALVKEGSTLQRRTKQLTEGKIGDVTGKVSKVAGEISKQATEGWDKLEQVFEDRVSRALNRLGVPTNKEIKALITRVEDLNQSVAAMSGKPVSKAKKVVAAKVNKTAKAIKSTKMVRVAKPTPMAKAMKSVAKTVVKSGRSTAAKVSKAKKAATKTVVAKVRTARKAIAKPVAAAAKEIAG